MAKEKKRAKYTKTEKESTQTNERLENRQAYKANVKSRSMSREQLRPVLQQVTLNAKRAHGALTVADLKALKSPEVIVFIKSLLSCEKKKKLPDLPMPSPDFWIAFLLFSSKGFILLGRSLLEILSRHLR